MVIAQINLSSIKPQSMQTNDASDRYFSPFPLLKFIPPAYTSDLFSVSLVADASNSVGSKEIKKVYREQITKNEYKGTVARVVDGDTIVVDIKDIGKVKVRYIGVDTPETKHPRKGIQCFGKEAHKKNTELVFKKEVRLELDVQKVDKYRRLLAYIYVKDENGKEIMINEKLVREGFARVATFPPNVKYVDLFLKAERDARNNNRGLWDQQNCP